MWDMHVLLCEKKEGVGEGEGISNLFRKLRGQDTDTREGRFKMTNFGSYETNTKNFILTNHVGVC